MNSKFVEGKIELIEDINLSVAVATEEGLVVPVIHKADGMSLGEISSTLKELTDKARKGGLSLRVRKGERLDRLLGTVVLAYILLLVLGMSEIGKSLRKRIEILRSKARHGTRRTLSVLTISLFAFSDSFLLITRDNLINILTQCFHQLEGEKVFLLPSF